MIERGYRPRELGILEHVARGLGLSLRSGTVTQPATLEGQVDGHAVRVGGLITDDDLRFGLWAGFVTPLDLGLQVKRRNTLSMIAAGFRDQSRFGLEYDVEADELPRAEALLVPALQEGLLAGASMDDLGIASSVIGQGEEGLPSLPEPSQVVESLRKLVDLASLAEKSCLQVPEASPLRALATQWSAFASLHQLDLLRTPLQLTGKLERTRLLASANRTGPNTYSLNLAATFESPLGIGLSVRRENVVDKLVSLLKPDIRFEDPEFDPLYNVAAPSPDVARSVLDSEARRLLSSLARKGLAPRLSDEELRVSFPFVLLGEEATVEVLDRVAAIAHRIQENASGAGRNGPYR